MTDGRNSDKIATINGFGAFNVLLLLAALPVAWTGIFDTTTTAFVLASAECDLALTFFRKGVLVAFPFVGTILTSFLWDHVTPYVGARNLFVLGLLVDTVLNILSSVVDSYHVFLTIKFLSGVLVGGPFSMVLQYLSEFHSAQYKASYARWAGLAVNAAIVVPAVVAFSVLPQPWIVEIFYRQYNAWRLYLLICSVVPLIGLLTACTLPQSPKYLVDIGRPDQALELLRRMYTINKWKSADSYPIKAILGWRNAQLSRRSFLKENSEKIRLASYNAKLLFSAPYLRAVSLLGILQFGSSLAFNTMRLWVPHLFIILNNFDNESWTENRAPTMTEMLNRRNSVPAKEYLSCPYFEDICIKWTIKAMVYQNSAIIAFSTVVVAFLAGTITNSDCRKKTLLLVGLLISVGSCFGINWAQAPPYMLTLAAAIIVTSRVALNIVTAVNVDVIPVPLRATNGTVLTTLGNVGAILGNIIFSTLLDLEPIAAFIGLGCLMLACSIVSFALPRPVKALQVLDGTKA
ncbi:Synaptic vesicle glycoprotein 2B [Dufourea novaeangliae]|nr:Synaptic vesicle glycoprotein 2B [Dufourea novaeangliae]